MIKLCLIILIYLIFITYVLFLFETQTSMKTKDFLKKHKIIIIIFNLILISLFVLPIIMKQIFSTNLGITWLQIVDKDNYQAWIGYYGAILGGALTLLGVWWTLQFEFNSRKESENPAILFDINKKRIMEYRKKWLNKDDEVIVENQTTSENETIEENEALEENEIMIENKTLSDFIQIDCMDNCDNKKETDSSFVLPIIIYNISEYDICNLEFINAYIKIDTFKNRDEKISKKFVEFPIEENITLFDLTSGDIFKSNLPKKCKYKLDLHFNITNEKFEYLRHLDTKEISCIISLEIQYFNRFNYGYNQNINFSLSGDIKKAGNNSTYTIDVIDDDGKYIIFTR